MAKPLKSGENYSVVLIKGVKSLGLVCSAYNFLRDRRVTGVEPVFGIAIK